MKWLKSKNAMVILLGIGHGLNDLIAGYFLGHQVQVKTDIAQVTAGLLLYNLLAFGGQYPVALYLERMKNPGNILQISYGLHAGAVVVFSFFPRASIILAGIASALYHVAGGAACAGRKKATHIGLFAAPGLAGLIIGGYLAYKETKLLLPLSLATIVFFVLLRSLRREITEPAATRVNSGKRNVMVDRHDIVMILLLTVISLRSVIWDVFQLIHDRNYEWLLAIAISAFAGKMAGGWLADRIGWRLYMYLSVSLATPFITFFKDDLASFCIGIGLLQSGIPATTSLLMVSMQGKTERAIGLSFGTAVILGAIPVLLAAGSAIKMDFLVSASILLLLLMLYLSGRRRLLSVS